MELKALCEAGSAIFVLSASFSMAGYVSDGSRIELSSNQVITIFGNGAVLDASGKGRLFWVEAGTSLTLESITMQNGYQVSTDKSRTRLSQCHLHSLTSAICIVEWGSYWHRWRHPHHQEWQVLDQFCCYCKCSQSQSAAAC